MFRPFSRWLQRRADASLKRENERLTNLSARLTEELAIERSKNRIQEQELALLAAVLARDVKRIESETAAAAQRIASAEREPRLTL